MIKLDGVSKIYKGCSEYAVNNISLQINRGDIYGLLGTNGAGKTTTFSMICGIFPPSHGQILIDNKSVRNERSHIKQKMGVVPQNIALYPMLTGRENLYFFGQMYGLKRKILNGRIEDYFRIFGMSSHADKKVKNYSGGMKRKINLIAGILHKPELILLDEPAVGIDAHSRLEIMEQLKAINKMGATILYTSHYLEEAEKFCTDIAILHEGSIIEDGKPQKLVKENDCLNLEDLFFKLTGNKTEH
jgi:ABC-2 type transport system ATP-binding protein